jgi:hypothetical protein
MKKISVLFFLLFIVTNFSQPLMKKQNAFSNYRIFPSTVTQTEVLVANHPFENTMFVSANSISFSPSFFVSEGVYVSTDGGNNWFGSDTCSGANILFHGGDPGITIDKDGRFILTRLGRIPFNGLYSHYSTDMGITWSNQYTLTDEDLERSTLVSDNNHLSQFYGRTYGVWVKFAPPYPLMISYTDNGAQSWVTPYSVNSPPQRCAGGDLILGSDGKLFACWASVAGSSPFTEIFVGFAVSSDGAATWNKSETAFPMNGIQGLLPEKQNIRVNGLPRIAVDTTGGPRNGWIYIATTQKNLSPAGDDPDIILNRSTDGGLTWSAGIRVNQDQLNNGKIQYFPAVHVDNYGGVNIIYYDDRNTSSDSAGLFLSRSMDGGNTWKDYEVSDHNFKPSPIGGLGQGYQGDNISLTSIDNILFPLWMDNSSGIYQIWTTKIDLILLDVEENNTVPEEFDLLQNYPNPFNPSTTLEFNLPSASYVKLKLYDMRGSEAAVLHDGELNKGSYKYNFDADKYGLSSGVYFFSLQTDNFRKTIKAVLLK